MQYSYIQQSSYVPPPQLKLNGGLYTGEPFKEGAPWANVPVVADIDYMIHHNLRSANPPLEALFQYPGTIRPGNNYQNMTGIAKVEDYSFGCTPCIKKACYDVQGVIVECEQNN